MGVDCRTLLNGIPSMKVSIIYISLLLFLGLSLAFRLDELQQSFLLERQDASDQLLPAFIATFIVSSLVNSLSYISLPTAAVTTTTTTTTVAPGMTTTTSTLLASAKTLTENSAGIDAAKTKVDSLANSTSGSRAAAATCAEVITIVTEITTAVAANPENSTITTLTSKITSISSSLVC